MRKQIVTIVALIFLLGCERSPTSELDWAIGTWHGTRRDADDGQSISMIVRVERLDGGQIERLEVASVPRPYVGVTIRSRNTEGKWTMTYANSTRQNISHLSGKLEANRSIWESSSRPMHGSRFISEQIDQDHWRRMQFVSEDAGETWKLLFTDELERDKANQ